MRVLSLSFAGAMVLLAACALPVDQPTELVSARTLMHSSGVPDTEGLADLVVDEQATQQNWLVRVERLAANFCSVEEGNVTPGDRKLLRFTVTTPNVGDADVFIGSPLAHMRSEEHTSELQSQSNLVCRLLLEKKKHES